MKFKKIKKTISPVIAIALLLVVSVVAVVSFQGWFKTYQGSMFSDVEIKSNKAISGGITIDSLIGNNIYVVNNFDDNLSIIELKIDDEVCTININLSLGMNEINVSDCIDNISVSSPDIVLITDNQIIQKKVLFESIVVPVTTLNPPSIIGSECRFKDNKSGCGSYYNITQIDGIDVIYDTLLGLYWQKNANSAGALNWTNAQAYCSGLGDGNWRLPTLVELETSLVDSSQSLSPYVVGGNSMFDNFQNADYWTYTKYSSSNAYFLDFQYGASYNAALSSSYYFICVKEDGVNYNNALANTQTFSYEGGIGQIRKADEFDANSSFCGGGYTMYDILTNLCWMMNSTTSNKDWIDSVDYCTDSTLAGGNWRLPNKAELLTLIYNNGYGTTDDWLNSIGFNDMSTGFYWSITDYPPTSAYAYSLYFDSGRSYYQSKTNLNRLICVKNP